MSNWNKDEWQEYGEGGEQDNDPFPYAVPFVVSLMLLGMLFGAVYVFTS